MVISAGSDDPPRTSIDSRRTSAGSHLPPELVLAPFSGLAETLDEQVLRVGAAVGHAPGDALVVTEVEGPRHPRHGVADDVDGGTGEVDLVVDGGHVQAAVGVAGHQGTPDCVSPPEVDQPLEPASISPRPVGIAHGGVEGLQAVEDGPLVLRPGRDGEQIAARIPLH